MFYSINITMTITELSTEFQYFIESFSLKNKQMCQSEEKKSMILIQMFVKMLIISHDN